MQISEGTGNIETYCTHERFFLERLTSVSMFLPRQRRGKPCIQSLHLEAYGFRPGASGRIAPPHGGMAYGLDRMVMLMLKKDSIRDVIAFPKVQNAGEPMSGAPDVVDEQQLKDLSIALTLKD